MLLGDSFKVITCKFQECYVYHRKLMVQDYSPVAGSLAQLCVTHNKRLTTILILSKLMLESMKIPIQNLNDPTQQCVILRARRRSHHKGPMSPRAGET